MDLTNVDSRVQGNIFVFLVVVKVALLSVFLAKSEVKSIDVGEQTAALLYQFRDVFGRVSLLDFS